MPSQKSTAQENMTLNTQIHYLEVYETLKKCKNSSPGPDDIPNILIKKLPQKGLKYLTEIYNLIWTGNVFPDMWKEATVIPIPKPGKDKTNASNYRPISLTCNMCKILEKIINNRLKNYLEEIKFFTPNQSGFRKKHSTTDHLITIQNAVLDAFSKKHHFIAISLDLEKAYDMIWRERIIKILEHKKIQGNMIK